MKTTRGRDKRGQKMLSVRTEFADWKLNPNVEVRIIVNKFDMEVYNFQKNLKGNIWKAGLRTGTIIEPPQLEFPSPPPNLRRSEECDISEPGSFSSSQLLFDELHKIFLLCKPNCGRCDKLLLKLTQHIFEAHHHSNSVIPNPMESVSQQINTSGISQNQTITHETNQVPENIIYSNEPELPESNTSPRTLRSRKAVNYSELPILKTNISIHAPKENRKPIKFRILPFPIPKSSTTSSSSIATNQSEPGVGRVVAVRKTSKTSKCEPCCPVLLDPINIEQILEERVEDSDNDEDPDYEPMATDFGSQELSVDSEDLRENTPESNANDKLITTTNHNLTNDTDPIRSALRKYFVQENRVDSESFLKTSQIEPMNIFKSTKCLKAPEIQTQSNSDSEILEQTDETMENTSQVYTCPLSSDGLNSNTTGTPCNRQFKFSDQLRLHLHTDHHRNSLGLVNEEPITINHNLTDDTDQIRSALRKCFDLKTHIFKPSETLEIPTKSNSDYEMLELRNETTENIPYVYTCPFSTGWNKELNPNNTSAPCKMQFQDIKLLRLHLQTDHEPLSRLKLQSASAGEEEMKASWPVCRICKEKALNVSSLGLHFLNCHPGEMPHVCKTCNKGFLRRYRLTVHERLHTSEKPFLCEVCNKSFKTIKHLYRHHLIHSDRRPYKCNQCGKAFKTRPILNNHIRCHSSEKLFMCEFCSSCFSRQYSLDIHKKYHSKEKSYICKQCDKGFKTCSGLASHRQIHQEKKHMCEGCGKLFTLHHHLRAHIRTHHNNTSRK